MSAGAIAGALVVLRLETTTAGTYVDMGGMRTKSLTINNEVIDTTNSDSTGRWRELLSGALATRSISFSGAGVFKDGTAQDRFMTVVMSASAEVKCQVFFPTLGTFEGQFKITTGELSGEHTDAVQYSASFESNGVIAFTNIA